MTTPPTGAAGKAPMKTLLAPYEKRFIQWLTPYFPKWIETWHLTLMTIPWCAVIGFGYLAGKTENLHWLWASSLMILHYYFENQMILPSLNKLF